MYFGRWRGLFRSRGIDLHLRYFWGGPELARAAASGRIQMGEMGLPPFSQAYANGLEAKVVGSSIFQGLDHYLVARPEISRIEQLAHKRIGILSRGSCDDYFIRRILAQASLDADKDVELVALGKSYGQLEPFSGGDIDAGFLVEPQVAKGEALGLVRILTSVRAHFPRYQWGIIFARSDFLASRGDLARRALAAYRQACGAIKAEPEAAVGFGAQVFGTKKEVFRRALYRDLDRWEVDGRLDVVGMENCLRVQEQVGGGAGLQARAMCCPL